MVNMGIQAADDLPGHVADGGEGGGHGIASPSASDHSFVSIGRDATPPQHVAPADHSADFFEAADGAHGTVVHDAGTQMTPEKHAIVPKQKNRKQKRMEDYAANRMKGDNLVYKSIDEVKEYTTRGGRRIYKPLDRWRNESQEIKTELVHGISVMKVLGVRIAEEVIDEDRGKTQKRRRKNKEPQEDSPPIAEDPDRTSDRETISAGGRGRGRQTRVSIVPARRRASPAERTRERSRSTANAAARSSREHAASDAEEHELRMTPPRHDEHPLSPEAGENEEAMENDGAVLRPTLSPRRWSLFDKPENSREACSWRQGIGAHHQASSSTPGALACCMMDWLLPAASSTPGDVIPQDQWWQLIVHQAPPGGVEVTVTRAGKPHKTTLKQTDVLNAQPGWVVGARNKSKRHGDDVIMKVAIYNFSKTATTR